MTDRPDDQTPERESYTPASPVKRILAWTGVVYMVGFVVLNLYPFFHQGSYLYGIAPLFACPGIGGMFAISLYLARHPDSPPSRKVSMGVLAAVCVAGFIISLYLGIPALLANFGGGQ